MMVILIILSDDEFQNLREGNKTVYIKVYNEYKKPVFNLLLSRSRGNREVAQDIMQETFLTAFKSLDRLKNPGHIEAWLITIAKNKLTDYFRKSARRKKYIETHGTETNMSPDVAEELHLKEQVALLHMGMEKINPTYRRLLTMRCWEDMSVKEIAEKIGRTKKAVENMLFRAKESLKKEITRMSKDFDR
jgi:RNA polymerase sigma factor (sigma-70 family)